MPEFVYGTSLFYKTFRENLELSGRDPESLSKDEVQCLMSTKAMQAKDEESEKAILRLNAIKKDYGEGISNLIMVYNASGVPLKKMEHHEESGYWSSYTLANQIEVGQWSVGFHHKTAGVARGSIGCIGFKMVGHHNTFGLGGPDDNPILMLGFSNPWVGRNEANVILYSSKEWYARSWEQKMNKVYKGRREGIKNYAPLKIIYEMGSETSPTYSIIITRSDNGV